MAKPKAPQPRIIDPEAAQMCAELKACKEVRANAEELEKTLKKKLEDYMFKFRDDSDANHFIIIKDGGPEDRTPQWDLNFVPGTNVSLSSDKLMEKGVAPDIIAFATTRTPYTSLRLDFVKQKVTK